MMSQKHLHELLKEDQEPFQLKNYIADRRCQLQGPSPNTQLQLKKSKPVSQKSKFPSNFCQNACFFSFHDEPEPRKSPPFEFPSPAKSPRRIPNKMFPHIPARTATLLLEAALRIQKQKTQNKNNSVGLLGSIKKELTRRIGTRKRENSCEGNTLSIRDILKWDSKIKQVKEQMLRVEEKSAFKVRTNGRTSSAGWSESNEDNKSLDLDLDTSCSSQLCKHFEEEVEFDCNEKENIDFASCEKHFCESPFSFVFQRSPSSGSRTPDFSSPATSPIRHTHSRKDKESNHQEIEVLNKFQVGAEEKEEEEEEEKEQCSPVSVLDPPFKEDDDRGNEDEDEDEDEDDDHFDMDCSFALVQRTKQQLLHKLRRFERLAELDPVELEKRMLNQQEDENDHNIYDTDRAEENEDYELESSKGEKNVDEFVEEVSTEFSFNTVRRIPEEMKRLVTDIITKEEKEDNCCVDREVIGKRVCRRSESQNENESNTIEMMVEEELRREVDGRNKYEGQVGEITLEIEIAILGLLIEELSEELGD